MAEGDLKGLINRSEGDAAENSGALELMTPAEQTALADRISEAVALELQRADEEGAGAGEKKDVGSGAAEPVQRILRLLKTIDAKTYGALVEELKSTLELLRDCGNEETRGVLENGMRDVIIERLGPDILRRLSLAELCISGDEVSFGLPGIIAAVKDLPVTIAETPLETRYVDAARAVVRLGVLYNVLDYQEHVFDARRIAITREVINSVFFSLRDTFVFGYSVGEGNSVAHVTIPLADRDRFIAAIKTLCDPVQGMKIRVEDKTTGHSYVHFRGKSDSVEAAYLDIDFWFDRRLRSDALTKTR